MGSISRHLRLTSSLEPARFTFKRDFSVLGLAGTAPVCLSRLVVVQLRLDMAVSMLSYPPMLELVSLLVYSRY